MQFLYGSLSTVVFFVCLYLAYRMGRGGKHPTITKHKEANEDERVRAEKLRQGFEELMSYDVKTALKGK